MEDKLQFDCPGCKRTLRVKGSLRGRTITCPGCAKKLKIPLEKKIAKSTPAPSAREVNRPASKEALSPRPTTERPRTTSGPRKPKSTPAKNVSKPKPPPTQKQPLAAKQNPATTEIDLDRLPIVDEVAPTRQTVVTNPMSFNEIDMSGFDVEDDLAINANASTDIDDFFGMEVPVAEEVAYVPPSPVHHPKSENTAESESSETGVEASPQVEETANTFEELSLPPIADPVVAATAQSIDADPFDEPITGPTLKFPVPQVAKTGVAKPAVSNADLRKAIRAQLDGKIAKRGVKSTYTLGLTLTAGFMLMLPMAYAGLIFLCSYGMYYFVMEVVPSLMSTFPGGRAAIIAFALYTGPLLVGGTIILFMIKPIFRAVIPEEGTRERSLSREGEPLLFELVDRICDVTGAPKPTRINVDAEVNASASYGRGLKSLFADELVLTIGVPLVAGLNTRQFAGVLAHEFGHFSQGASMRASYIIRAINFWFARIVYERDGIDDALDDMIEDSVEPRIALALMVTQFFVTITRGILWVFMMVAHLSSCFLLRQMEFDADRYEVHVAGSKNFASTCQAMRMLGFAQNASLIGMKKLLDKAVMIDNLPRMTELLQKHMTKKQRSEVIKKANEETTGIFDTHPCDRERIGAALEVDVEGMFQIERPASDLFQHYDALCQNVTQDFYRNVVDRMVSPDELQPVEEHMGGLV